MTIKMAIIGTRPILYFVMRFKNILECVFFIDKIQTWPTAQHSTAGIPT